ncbi:MAG: ZIP family metal transporter [Bacteroidia bacterium]
MEPILYISLLFLPVLIAGITVFYVKLTESHLKLLLAFSAAYLLALSFLHLIPEIFSSLLPRQAGLWILAGFFIQVLLEFFSSGIEHGHAHIHAEKNKIPLVLLCGLYLHSFIEGLPLANIFNAEQSKQAISFLMGVTLHNIPISLAFAGLLIHQQIAKNKIILYLLLLASMAPFGALIGHFIEITFGNIEYLSVIFTAIVVGIFLHISTTIIFESSEKNHRYHITKLLSILLGVALAYILT